MEFLQLSDRMVYREVSHSKAASNTDIDIPSFVPVLLKAISLPVCRHFSCAATASGFQE
jgi:hypothetical protein